MKDEAVHVERASTSDVPVDIHPSQSASTVGDKDHTAEGHSNYHGIDTRALSLGAEEVYEKKISIMNEALIDLGMGSFQWKVFAMTGFGWFVDNVSLPPFIAFCHCLCAAETNYH